MDTTRGKLVILYGSQTGCSQEVAERIAREGRRRLLRVEVSPMDEYRLDALANERLAVFVCSSTGQGEPPDNMKRFWRGLLARSLPTSLLRPLSFGVLGLGDTSYAKFNHPAKKLQARLLQLGASPLIARGDGDDQHPLGVDGALDPWLVKLWTAVDVLFPHGRDLPLLQSDILPPASFDIVFCENENVNCDNPNTADLTGVVVVNARLTPNDHFQDTRHIEIRLPPAVSYAAGDVLVMHPQNLRNDVQIVINHFQWEEIADKKFTLTPTNPDMKLPHRWPRVLTLREALTKYLDIFGKPRRYFFELASFFSNDEVHAAKLREFSTASGQPDLYTYAHRPKRTIFEVLQDFHSISFPPSYLFDLVPPIRQRSFSISSSPVKHGDTLHLTVAVVEYKTELKVKRRGVCTKWMSEMKVGDSIFDLSISRGLMTLPSPSSPLLLICAGTGIAPIRSLLYTRLHARPTAETMLVFGCRFRDKDYYYREEIEEIETQGVTVRVAFSRDGAKKSYVQHIIKEEKDRIWSLIQAGGHVLVSGNASRLPDAIKRALEDVFQSAGEMTPLDAQKKLVSMEKEERLVMECWA